ncbi:MAG: AmmeMemoRadiSam system protein A [Bacteroidota bacterium]|nr:AmmeMemoRadiSam system protein A [Bacteroidota bacterium]
MIPASARAALIQLTRKAIERAACGTDEPLHDLIEELSVYHHAGVFVTITIDGRLRGCIGHLNPATPLGDAVVIAAEGAAERDFRFSPLACEELPHTKIDITLMEPMEPLHDPSEIVIGVHGLYIEDGFQRGILLPKVAFDHGWDAETFLAAVCRKAGLSENTWHRPGVTLKKFSATVISTDFASPI